MRSALPALEPPNLGVAWSPADGYAQDVAFWLCCAYVLSQIYMVPLWLVGPSWSVWPSATDLIVLLMLIWLPFVRESQTTVPEIATVRRYLVLLACGSLVSFFALTLNPLNLKTIETSNEKGQYFGLYQIYRFGQFLVVFWLVSRINLTQKRGSWLRRVIAMTFWTTSASILANYFDVLQTPTLAPQIPKSLGIAGPWAFYSLGMVGNPVGAISFHHAYPAVQLLLLAAVYICLMPSRRIWLPSLILISLFVCCLVSGSRAGFVAACVFAIIVAASRPRQLLILAAITIVAVPVGLHLSDDFSGAFSRAIDRQRSITTSYDEDGFAGRVEIWNDRLALLNRDPMLWVTGTGYGSAVETGNNGHMLFLHITLECGLIGLAAFIVTGQRVMTFLWRAHAQGRVMCYASVALTISAFTQETFYPVPALGHFCGMYLFCVVVALQRPGASAPKARLRMSS